MGIESYDVLPHWAREFLPFIIKNYGKGIVKYF